MDESHETERERYAMAWRTTARWRTVFWLAFLGVVASFVIFQVTHRVERWGYWWSACWVTFVAARTAWVRVRCPRCGARFFGKLGTPSLVLRTFRG